MDDLATQFLACVQALCGKNIQDRLYQDVLEKLRIAFKDRRDTDTFSYR